MIHLIQDKVFLIWRMPRVYSIVCVLFVLTCVVGVSTPGFRYFLVDTVFSVSSEQARISFVGTSIVDIGPLGPLTYTGIYIVNPQTFNSDQVVPLRQLYFASVADPTWRADGNAVIYSANQSLHLINRVHRSQVTRVWKGWSSEPSWSPNGMYVVFVSNGTLWILDLKTQEVKQLNVAGKYIVGSEPIWSPNGDEIAFTMRGGKDPSSIGVISFSTNSITVLTNSDGSAAPSWSPDGKKIVFERNGSIYTLDLDTSEINQVIDDGLSHQPVWSPDGKYIAFVSMRSSQCIDPFADQIQFCTSELHSVEIVSGRRLVIRSRVQEGVSDPAWVP